MAGEVVYRTAYVAQGGRPETPSNSQPPRLSSRPPSLSSMGPGDGFYNMTAPGTPPGSTGPFSCFQNYNPVPRPAVVRSSGSGVTREEVKAMMEEMSRQIRKEVMGDMQKEIHRINGTLGESHRSLAAGLEKSLLEIWSLRQDYEQKVLRQSFRRGSSVTQGEESRGMSKLVGAISFICNPHPETESPTGKASRFKPEPLLTPVAEQKALEFHIPEPPSLLAATAAAEAVQREAAAPASSHSRQVTPLPPKDVVVRAPAPVAVVQGVLGPTVQHFRAALQAGPNGRAVDVNRKPFVEGLESYAAALDQMGGNMGSYLICNTKKLRQSKASPELLSYRAWMLSELPVHAATRYQGYVDESAWMANLWIGWTMEFFVEMFAELHQGQDTKAAVDKAYKQTLEHHHNFMQRMAFNQAVKQLPERNKIIAALQGRAAKPTDVQRDMGDLVALGRPLVSFSLQMNEEVSARMQQERQAYLQR